VYVLALGIGLANAFKPVHIDDTLYLRIAERIVTHPADPYGGVINWQHTPTPAYQISISPPLLSYYFAVFLGLGVPTEFGLHLAMVPWLLLLAWSLLKWGALFSRDPNGVAWLVLCGPAVIVGTNLMLDVPLTAAMVASIAMLIEGSQTRSWKQTWLAGFWGTVAVLIKYPGVIVIAVGFIVALVLRSWRALVPAILATLALAGWQVWSQSVYGAGQIQQATDFLERFQGDRLRDLVSRMLQMLVLLTMSAPAFWLGFLHTSVRTKVVSIIGGIATGVVAWFLMPISAKLAPELAVTVVVVSMVGGFLAKTFVARMPIRFTLVRESKPTGHRSTRPFFPVIFVWITGCVVITVLGAPFVAVRYFLPMQPAMACWVCRMSTHRTAVRWISGIFLCLSVGLAWNDHCWAAFYRETIEAIRREFPHRSGYFAGHWGWQYHAEQAGFVPWNALDRDAPAGTLFLIPQQADPTPIHPRVIARLRLLRQYSMNAPVFPFITWSVNPKSSAGVRFYGGAYPHLPWWFSRLNSETIGVFEVVP
jgi:hypothetical protein